MSAEFKELVAFRDVLTAMREDTPLIMAELAVGEGVFARTQAVNLCEEKKVDNTSNYKRNFNSDSRAQRSGHQYKITFYNNADYAKELEYGFRSHFVPGHWEGNSFVYNRKDPEGGMYVGPPGGYVKGKYIFMLSVRRTKLTQDARLRRKLGRIFNRYMKGFV